MTTKTLELDNIERKIFWTLLTLLGLVAVFYLYSVLSLTFAVVDRRAITAKTHELANTVGSLESEYLNRSNSMTLAYAESLGFQEVNVKFADSSSAGIASASGMDGIKLSMAR